MKSTDHSSTRGILQSEAGMRNFSLMRYEPAPELASLIEHYWVVRWDLRGQSPYEQTILSYPNINLSFEKTSSGLFTGVYGVPSSKFTRFLQDEGTVLGVKFRSGGFYPFWKQPVSKLTDHILPFRDVFGIEATELEERIWAQEDGDQMARLAELYLLEHLPEKDERVELINRIVETAIHDREIVRVEDIASRFDISMRTLQRLFSRYVGVSPKWVIQRYRLQEAADRMEQGEITDWPKLSQDLGYYDQAHFIKDFKALIGKSPEEYMKAIRHE